MPKQFKLDMIVHLPAEEFAAAAVLMAVQPVVASFVEALKAAKIEAKITHDVVTVRGKKKAATTTPRAVA